MQAARQTKDLQINEKQVKHGKFGLVQSHHKEMDFGVISCNDNGPVILISNVYSELPHTTLRCLKIFYYDWQVKLHCSYKLIYSPYWLGAHVSVSRIDGLG